MSTATDAVATNLLDGPDPDDVGSARTRRDLDQISDERLLASACEVLAVAHREPADSFGLHAPLETMARARLLRSVSVHVRAATRRRIARIAATWATSGTPVEADCGDTIEHPVDTLVAAVRDGDPASADRAFVALCAERSTDEVIGDVTDVVLPHLGGAAHGTIFLELLGCHRPTGGNPALMARTLVRDLADHPGSLLTWFAGSRPSAAHDTSLTERLIAPATDRAPSDHFVYPTMSLVEESGLAFDLLGDATVGMSVAQARRELLRVAAHSMIQDEPSNAPYGWSHCLTLPQAALSIAHRASDPQIAIDVAATFVLGYRATQSSTPIDPNWVPEHPGRTDGASVVELDRATAAAVAWHADPQHRESIVQQLVDHAAPHHDAHLAKYTLACLDATRSDPDAAHLYLAAAAHLGAWWHDHDRAGPSTS